MHLLCSRDEGPTPAAVDAAELGVGPALTQDREAGYPGAPSLAGVLSVPDWSLLEGPLPVAVTATGAVTFAALAAYRGRRWWTRRLPLAVAAGAAFALLVAVLVNDVWQPFPDPLPTAVLVWLGAAATGVGAAIVRPRPASRRSRGRMLAALGALLVVAAAAVQINLYFGQYPTVGSALGLTPAGQIDLSQVAGNASSLVTPVGGRPLSDVWQPPPTTPATGAVSEVVIPATVSGFPARPGWVYLPPAYLTMPRAQLPVLVLLAGQPGSPRDWLDGGRLAERMDRFAGQHGGLAPVVVIPDDLGGPLANPLCLDSRLGQAETYLTVDVPAWIRSTLQVDPAPRAWAVGGFSNGGTCALQLAVRAPGVYPSFVDVSGQDEPTLGERQRTVQVAFGGDHVAFASVNPLDLLARTPYPASAGMIVVGRDDTLYLPQQQHVLRACRGAGMDMRWLELPGGHTWHVWGPGMEQSLPWLAARLGLTAATSGA